MCLKIVLAIFTIIGLAAAHNHQYNGENGQARYNFDYRVNDPQTRDVKSQREQRDGDRVTGEYTLRESDGTIRVVRYKAGPQSGFEAEVERRGDARHPSQSGHSHRATGGNFRGQSDYLRQYDQRYNNEESNENNVGTSHIGTIRWRNQGHGNFGSEPQYNGINKHEYRYGQGNNNNGATSHVGTIRWRNQGHNYHH